MQRVRAQGPRAEAREQLSPRTAPANATQAGRRCLLLTPLGKAAPSRLLKG